MVIYKITNVLNGMIYVGQTQFTAEKRFKQHAKADSYIGAAIREYGAENFTVEVLETCQTREQADEREIFFIKKFDCMFPNGYNRTEGGSFNGCKKSPFRKFIQMNNDEHAREADDWLIAKSPTAYRIFRFLVSNMDTCNEVVCSYKVIQKKFGYSKATVTRAVKLLKDHKYIDVARTSGANIYMINKHLYWNSWGTNFAYAEFDAKVIISASEQDDDIQTKIKSEIKRRQEVVQSPPTFREQIQQIQQNEKIN